MLLANTKKYCGDELISSRLRFSRWVTITEGGAMRNNNRKLSDWDIMSNRGSVPDELPAPEPLHELIRHSQITCHGGGQPHAADVCLECPRYVGVRRTEDSRGVEVRCWWHADPTLESVVTDDRQCDSCGTVYAVSAHPAMDCVMICRECLELSTTPMDFSELDIGH